MQRIGRAVLLSALLVALAVCVAAATIPVQLVQTARDTNDRLTRKPDLAFVPDDGSSTPALTVDTTQRFQTIFGFGGAFTEASAVTLGKLSADNVEKILDLYWGDNGIGYTVGRFHINSCDFSVASYSFDDTPWDFDLKNFNIEHDRHTLIPYIKRAMALNRTPIRIFASPWSPPAWMKTNHQMTGSLSPGLNATCHRVWAEYLSKTISAYEAEGIPVWGMTVQNEPLFAAPWEACMYTGEQERDFVKQDLGPVMRRDHPNLKIMIYDHNKDEVANFARPIYQDPDASQYVWGTAVHWYSGPQFENLDATVALDPSKYILATEACNCPPAYMSWPNGENYGYDIIGDLNHHVVGWTDWNMVLDEIGGPNHLKGYCDSPVIADTRNNTFRIQPPYYYMGQISKFVKPGSVRVALNMDSKISGVVSAAAFVTPSGETVVVAMNRQDTPVSFKLRQSNMMVQTSLPAHSIQTYVYQFPNVEPAKGDPNLV